MKAVISTMKPSRNYNFTNKCNNILDIKLICNLALSYNKGVFLIYSINEQTN